MDDKQNSSPTWILRIAAGVLVGNVLFALCAWFLALSAQTFGQPSSAGVAAPSNGMTAEQMADEMERQADNLEAMANGN